ncbi:hypothetical protein ACFLWG_01925 [Chloroflexota bacterium]
MEYVRDVVVALSAGTVAIAALLGLRAWKKELTGKARFETANHMWRLGSEFGARLTGIRLFRPRPVEWADRVPSQGETYRVTNVLNDRHAIEKRLISVRESLDKIIQVQWEAELLLPESSAQSVKEVVQSYGEIYLEIVAAVVVFFDTRFREAQEGVLCTDQEGLKKTED